jgi:hypothetical protein
MPSLPPRWSGRVRGRPPPWRPTRMPSITGMNCGASPHWPGVISRDTGRRARPHRRDGFCKSVRPESVQVPRRDGVAGACAFSRHPRQTLACASCVLMGTAGRRVHAHHRPVDTALGISVDQDGCEDPVPGAVRRPSPMPLVHRLPRAEMFRQIPPRHPGPEPEEDPVDDPDLARRSHRASLVHEAVRS